MAGATSNTDDVGAALAQPPTPWDAIRRVLIASPHPQIDDRRAVDNSTPHVWGPDDFEDPDNPKPLPPITPMARSLGAADIHRPTADEVMRYILHNNAEGDEPMTNSVVRKSSR